MNGKRMLQMDLLLIMGQMMDFTIPSSTLAICHLIAKAQESFPARVVSSTVFCTYIIYKFLLNLLVCEEE
jgi:hypothetical protein